MITDGWFPNSYEEGRLRFRNWAQTITNNNSNVKFEEFRVPSKKDQDLTVDILYVPSTSKKIFILSSGVHGPEGFAGSAIQNLFFEKYLDLFLKHNISVFVIHGVNPYGFKFNRRATENNVNLNRNFDIDKKLFKNSNAGYRFLRPFLEIKAPVEKLKRSTLTRSLKLLGLLALGKLKMRETTQAFGQGQYEFPQGIEFGGHTFEPQVKFLSRLFSEVTKPYSDILFIDLHTGLGRRQALQLITGETPLTPASAKAMEQIFGETIRAKTFHFVNGDTAGFYHTHGDFVSLLPKIWGSHKNIVLCLTAEFGTVGDSLFNKLKSLNRMILENQGFHNGYKTEALKIKSNANFRELFFPTSPAWRKNALEKSECLFKSILEKY